jgi:hypothetical protein
LKRALWGARSRFRRRRHELGRRADGASPRLGCRWASKVGLHSVSFHVGEQMSVVFAKESDGTSV